ncbi:unnamed protein product [Owenia fusiformis]|uniref:STAS domain-containing protein n=1 Tax=Owenia fusiformis TaxID=6347 RepID=A0A8S4NRX9_OWEFU|nr:unnamed protein product [Owenia fusiformis]
MSWINDINDLEMSTKMDSDVDVSDVQGKMKTNGRLQTNETPVEMQTVELIQDGEISKNGSMIKAANSNNHVMELMDKTYTKIGGARGSVQIERKSYTQTDFDGEFAFNKSDEKILPKVKRKLKRACTCSKYDILPFICRIIPMIGTLKNYKWKKDIVGDIVSGISVGVVHIPQSMGFAALAFLPPVYGLYSATWPVLLYCVLGSSRHVSFGTMAVIALMVGVVVKRQRDAFESNYNGTITNLTAYEQEEYDLQVEQVGVDAALSVSFIAGLFQIGFGICQLGFITAYFSDAFISAFVTAASVHILSSQVRFMLGIHTLVYPYSGPLKLIYTYRDVFLNIHVSNTVDVITSVVAMVVLVAIKMGINERFSHKLKVPIPADFIVLVAGLLISHFGKFHTHYNVKVIGEIPLGVPTPRIPPMVGASSYIGDAVVIGIVGYTVAISMAKVYAERYKYTVNDNQEMFAGGVANGVGAILHCFAGTVAPPRCILHEKAGGKTQIAFVVSALILFLVIMVMGPLFYNLQNSLLGAIICVAIAPMFGHVRNLKLLWNIDKIDFLIWLVTFLAGVILDLDYGLYVGVGFSFLTIIIRSQFINSASASNAPNTEIYIDYKTHDVKRPTRVYVYQFNSPLLFTNVQSFKSRLLKETGPPLEIEKISLETTGIEVGETERRKAIVIDCKAIAYADSAGAKCLRKLQSEYRAAGQDFVFANCTKSLQTLIIKQINIDGGVVSDSDFYITVHDAVVDLTY